jgi:outer membrane lipoprotein SlyB
MPPNAVVADPAGVLGAPDGLAFGGFRGSAVDAARGASRRALEGATVADVFKRLAMADVDAMIAQTPHDKGTHARSGA